MDKWKRQFIKLMSQDLHDVVQKKNKKIKNLSWFVIIIKKKWVKYLKVLIYFLELLRL